MRDLIGRWWRILALGVGGWTLACAQSGFLTGVEDPAGIRVLPSEMTLAIGDVRDVRADLVDSRGRSLVLPRGTEIRWSVSDPGIAAVTAGGVLSATGSGATTVAASLVELSTGDTLAASGGRSARVTVHPPLGAVVVEPAADTLTGIGDSAYLTATAYDTAGSVVPGVSFAWASTDEGVVEVDDMGRIVAHGAGIAFVIASALGSTDTAAVTVIPADGPETYYVAPGGSDADAGTKSAPWRTLGHALAQLEPGQTLLVRGGTYHENITNPRIRPGRPDARIRVVAYPGETPVIRGLLWLDRPSYWTLDGINVTWSITNGPTDHMVKMTDGVGWVFENAELWGARSFSGLLVYGSVPGEPANWVVRGNCIHDVWTEPVHHVNGDHNLYVNTGTSAGPGLIERNLLFNAPNGQNIKLGYGRSAPEPGDGSANVTVRYNTMVGSLKNLMLADETHGVTIERNIVVDGEEGYAIRAYRLTGGNNTFRDNLFGRFDRLQYGDPGYSLVSDGGGNLFPRDPEFDGVACNRLRPADPAARMYGRYAPN